MDPLLLAIDAAMGAGCVVFYFVEKRRAEAWERAGKTSPKGIAKGDEIVLQVAVVGAPGTRVSLGASIESYQKMSANPLLEGDAITVRTQEGETFALPSGVKRQISTIDGAHRALVDSTTEEGEIRHRFSFEVDVGRKLYLRTRKPTDDGRDPYRADGPPGLSPSGDHFELSESALTAATYGAKTAFPGCWIMLFFVVLGTIVGGSAAAPSKTIAWIGTCVAVLFFLVGLLALPSNPPELGKA
jgi:hypothetical protein